MGRRSAIGKQFVRIRLAANEAGAGGLSLSFYSTGVGEFLSGAADGIERRLQLPRGRGGRVNADERRDVAVAVDGIGILPIRTAVRMHLNIALNDAAVGTCQAFDLDGNGQVTINRLIADVNSAQDGCAGPAT